MNTPELNIQIAFINFLDYQYPGILYCASAGGLRTSMKQAVKMKKSGYRKGFPDMFIYEPARGYSGLAIEIKAPGGTKSAAQKEWIRRLNENGFYAAFATGLDECIAITKAYLK